MLETRVNHRCHCNKRGKMHAETEVQIKDPANSISAPYQVRYLVGDDRPSPVTLHIYVNMCRPPLQLFLLSGEEQTALAGTIKAIDKGSVHRICSGQVVLTLATAVKELIENSIDAGATTVEVKLRDYGSQLVEVVDNGSGVEEKNFEGLTLKHHTSKLQDFSDLVGVETFGFRGEALSSLCALSGLTVVTRHSSSDVGTKLEFDHNGKISQKTAQARQVGTTVTLQNIFSTLPVRHKEFQRNIKKEFAKMVNVLNSYCIISTNVRITCYNQTVKGQRSIVVSSKGNSILRENISNVFGPKQLNNLQEIKQISPNEEVSCEYSLGSSSQGNVPFRLEGYVSKCVHGQGRSSADRQYFFINKRPCDSTKLSKVINEVYHQYNRHQYPFVALNVTMARDTVDVNVTPDKRQIFMQGEKLLLATVKTSLLTLYQQTVGVLQFKPVPMSLSTESSTKVWQARNYLNRTTEGQVSASSDMCFSSLSRLKRTYASVFSTPDDSPSKEQVSKQRKLDTFVTRNISSPSDSDLDPTQTKVTLEDDTVIVLSEEVWAGSRADKPTDCESGISSSKDTSTSGSQGQSSQDTMTVGSHGQSSQDTLTEGSQCQSSQDTLTVGSQGQSSQDTLTVGSQGQSSQGTLILSSQDSLTPGFRCQGSEETVNWNSPDQNIEDDFSSQSEHLELLTKDVNEENTRIITSNNHSQSFKTSLSDNNLDISLFSYGSTTPRNVGDSEPVFTSLTKAALSVKPIHQTSSLRMSAPSGDTKPGPSSSSSADDRLLRGGDETEVTEFEESEAKVKHEKAVKFCMSSLRTKASKRQQALKANKSKDQEFYRTFRANITPTDNQSAEEELQREITQEMFEKMEILGQFNLGFIVVKNREDLFIIDQHATDEKYNFEQLQKHTVLQSQRLIQPKNLELTASNETILMDNLEIFHQNGFDFLIDEQAPPTQRVKLVSTPVSKNWNFGKEDVEEMIFMLSDSPGVMCRPSRVRQMFASRSCRKSVMIGTALNKAEMKKLVTHMGEIEQPWNCPHGRPTMRHLINLNMVPK
ncbi:mismatch repair endonuclease PMS2-like isoform X3 [Mizuhopecten yessoensis]|uniref:mismatch repair endonuclease PMS2-like isoform X3 n=1 Tax=Mizuhopecten yessoensis TaxID=6573 RepID=UPI000B45C714|nr:mismatch repair endonuclease PMS2-like isoform X3 [Mizuhopecten yessoensis]